MFNSISKNISFASTPEKKLITDPSFEINKEKQPILLLNHWGKSEFSPGLDEFNKNKLEKGDILNLTLDTHDKELMVDLIVTDPKTQQVAYIPKPVSSRDTNGEFLIHPNDTIPDLVDRIGFDKRPVNYSLRKTGHINVYA